MTRNIERVKQQIKKERSIKMRLKEIKIRMLTPRKGKKMKQKMKKKEN